MPFDIEIATLCHSAIIQEGNLSILAAFDRILVDSLPHQFPPFALACRLRFPATAVGDHSLTATVSDNEARVLAQMNVAFKFFESSEQQRTLNLTFPITGMELRAATNHYIELALDDEPPVRIPFMVVHGSYRKS